MIDKIFTALPESFLAGTVDEEISYYFSLGDVKKTVFLSTDRCVVEEGKGVEKADCVCKTSADFFVKIWDEGYRPGMKDFLSGAIKSNNPSGLQTFLSVFGK